MELSVIHQNGRGRKKQVGSIIALPHGGVGAFVGYCTGCSGKICMDFTDARDFARKYQKQTRKPFNRILINLLRKLEQRSR